MGIATDIEWCDSTLNLQMGCDGCELWNPKAGIKHCYAGTLTARHAGKTGWPVTFEQPATFLGRLDAALRWPDLTGKERPFKPWLNGRPRMVFLNDMGDTYTESLPVDWLAPVIERMGQSPHIWMVLTKRPQRMLEAAKAHGFPRNFWLGVSVTDQGNAGPRIRPLLEVARLTGCKTFLSCEPLLGPVKLKQDWLWEFDPNASRDMGAEVGCSLIGLVIAGGESGPGARPSHPDWFRSIRDQCAAAGVAFFFKQWGEYSPSVEHAPSKGVETVRDQAGNVVALTWPMQRVGKKTAGRMLEGRTWDEMPEVSR